MGQIRGRRAANQSHAFAAVVVDQLGAWVLQMHAKEWAGAKPGDPRCHGFCRLMNEGTYYERMEYAHAITDTAPGHATLFTGEPPRVHGITQNERAILDPAQPGGMLAVGILLDEHERIVGTGGPTALVGPSLAGLKVDTVADQLRAADPNACIVSVSLKDRAALFGGGRHPTVTSFYEPSASGFVTTTALAQKLSVAASLQAPPHETRVWQPLDATWLAAHAPTADAQPGEGDYRGLGTTFPHPLAGKAGGPQPAPAAAYRMTPFGDEDVRTVARQSLALCKQAATTLVATSFSTHDYVAHTFGAHSWEAWDQFARLDLVLEGWLKDLDAEFGKDGWSLVLSADHGSVPLPELSRRPWCDPGASNPWDLPCAAGVRLAPGVLYHQLQARAERELGPGAWIGAVTDPRIALSTAARTLTPARRAKLVAALENELMKTGGVERVIDLAGFGGPCGPEVLGRDDADLVRRTVCQSQGPAVDELYVVVKKGSFFDPGYTLGKGVSHGSPWLYDRSVPLLVRTPHGQAALHPEPISYRTYAHTLRQWLGLARK